MKRTVILDGCIAERSLFDAPAHSIYFEESTMNANSRSTQPGCRVEPARAQGGTNVLASRFRNALRATLLATLASFATGCESTGDTTPVTIAPTPSTAQTVVLAETVTVTNPPATIVALGTNIVAGTNTLTGTNLPPEAAAEITNNQQVTVIQTEAPKLAPPRRARGPRRRRSGSRPACTPPRGCRAS